MKSVGCRMEPDNPALPVGNGLEEHGLAFLAHGLFSMNEVPLLRLAIRAFDWLALLIALHVIFVRRIGEVFCRIEGDDLIGLVGLGIVEDVSIFGDRDSETIGRANISEDLLGVW